MDDIIEDARINRRQFLRVVSFTTGGAALAPFISGYRPVNDLRASRRSRFYSGTKDGKVLGSADGRNWNVVTNFGPHLTVREVRLTRGDWVQVTLVTGDNSFILRSRDEKTWYTPDYVAPGQA